MTVVADTGAIYALIDASDAWHDDVTAWWAAAVDDIVLPVTIVPEVAYLLQRRIGAVAEEAFVRSIADAELVVEPLLDEDMPRIADIMRGYRDLPLGFVDASVIAVAERLGTRDVLTTDRRHFAVVRPGHARSLALLP
ncbi:MAG TPA: PIN domain-containing protein [Gemmatimonadaceae bacterium]|nr:PIN domain-containing protein [Gemmatimonadaceae bacterium]